MIFYTGAMFPEWHGNALIGGLTSQELVRVVFEGREVADEERIALGARIREVEQGPDGAVYVLTDQDDGNVWRITPAR
ncbi:MAG TPA: PQQ-dependent sugar dehydrogenase, partial [Alphaproteobacteria bacterium]|nr:PQQ-dependent sugar dehydrogenase [Alphaproteobacteria bacterium]